MLVENINDKHFSVLDVSAGFDKSPSGIQDECLCSGSAPFSG